MHREVRAQHGPLRGKDELVDIEAAIAELQERLTTLDKTFKPKHDVRDCVSRKTEGRLD